MTETAPHVFLLRSSVRSGCFYTKIEMFPVSVLSSVNIRHLVLVVKFQFNPVAEFYIV